MTITRVEEQTYEFLGRLAADIGYSENDNPYSADSAPGVAWLNGYRNQILPIPYQWDNEAPEYFVDET